MAKKKQYTEQQIAFCVKTSRAWDINPRNHPQDGNFDKIKLTLLSKITDDHPLLKKNLLFQIKTILNISLISKIIENILAKTWLQSTIFY